MLASSITFNDYRYYRGVEGDKLTPAIGYDLACPPLILKIISCSYKSGNCSFKSCGCNNMGLTCSAICRVNENDTDEDETLLPGDMDEDSE